MVFRLSLRFFSYFWNLRSILFYFPSSGYFGPSTFLWIFFSFLNLHSSFFSHSNNFGHHRHFLYFILHSIFLSWTKFPQPAMSLQTGALDTNFRCLKLRNHDPLHRTNYFLLRKLNSDALGFPLIPANLNPRTRDPESSLSSGFYAV